MKTYTLAAIAEATRGSIKGEAALDITGIQFIHAADPGQITFIGTQKYAAQWSSCRASAAIVSSGITLEPGDGKALIFVPDADLATSIVLGMFAPPDAVLPIGIHPTAVISPTAVIGEGASIGAHCYVGPGVRIGAAVRLYPHVCVFDESVIGYGSVLWSGVVVRDRCEIGERCILHPNVTIGADGFGYRPAPGGHGLVKIPQIGTVKLGNDVEIGANSAVDRAKCGATTIGDMTKIDNLVQVGHNVVIGRCCAFAAQVAIAGSTRIGDECVVGGCVSISDHSTIGNRVQIGGRSAVFGEVPDGAVLLGMPARDPRETMRIWAALPKLPELLHIVKKLENALHSS
jgi:UDP-3-O-[3-hydroxymyristoyl] glucosamine N-acyltransferase